MDFDDLKLGLLNDEIQWGLRYRGETKRLQKPPVLPKMSPINIQLLWQRYQITRKIHELEIIKRQLSAKSPPKHLNLKPPPGMKQIDRAALSTKQYINFLSTPTRHCCPSKVKDPLQELKRSLRHEPRCSARIMELSKPTKLRVYHTWKDFRYLFPAEVIVRLNELLQTDHTLEPAFARCCFKDFDRKKRKIKYDKDRKHKKIDKQRRKDNMHWLKTQIELTVNVIIEYFQQGGLLSLNYKQMLISDVIIDVLVCQGCFKKRPMRCSCKPYERALVDVVDQLAVWMDTILRYIDAQYPESEEAESSIICMEEEGGEEGGEDNLGYLLCRQRLAELAKKIAELKTEKYDMTKYEDEGLLISDLIEEEGQAFSLPLMLDKLICEDDPLTRLINILSLSPPEFLRSLVDDETMPGITYGDVLERLKMLQDIQIKQEKEKRKNVLEQTMVDWAKTNDPDKVNKEILAEIEAAAQLIAECIRQEREGKEDKSQTVKESTKEEKTQADEETKTFDVGLSSSMDEKLEESSKPLQVEEVSTVTDVGKGEEVLDTDHDVSDISSYGAKPEETKSTVVKYDHGEAEEGKEAVCVEDIFGIIPKHKPSRVFEHAPDTICCLTIKVWATWLLEVANNAQKWSEWLTTIIREIKRIASIIRGEVVDEEGNMVMYYKDDWREFVEKVEQMILSWRQYSMHVKDLTDKIINNFHGKRITCCPKCLEDNLIVNIAVAHDISQQLAEAMNTASYWRRWLDSVVQETQALTQAGADADMTSEGSSFAGMELVEIRSIQEVPSEESIYELVEL